MAEFGTVSTRHPRTVRTDVVRLLLMFVAFAVTLGGLHTILEGIGWWVLSMALCAVVFGAGLLVRMALPARSVLTRVLSPVVGLVAVAVTVVVRFSSDVSILGFIPTAETVDRFRTLVRDAGYSITWQNVPANADEPISFVLALGVATLAIVAEVCAFSVRLPALVGLPLAAIFLIPGLTPEGATDGWFFAGSALVYLAVLLAERPQRFLPAVAVGALAVVGGLILPSVLPSTDFTSPSSGLGPSVATGVNPMLHLGDDLRENDKHVALTYSTVSNQPEYLRMVEVSNFYSSTWGPAQPTLDPNNRPVEFPRPPGLGVEVSTEREVSYIHVANLLSPWLPVPYPSSSITGLQGSWQYLPDSFTVASNATLARGENYTVSSIKLVPTPEQLLAAGSTVPSGLDEYLALPPDTPALIAETAKTVAAGTSSSYEKALAIQEYLRSPPFQYSETAPVTEGYDGTGVDYVAAFLEQHRGYCIHFASAMAVMARELGIPSRIIVGFQPGHLQNGDDRGRHLFEVTTADLHAWPELYFDGIGWVRFEPTPSRGSVPAYANPATVGVPSVQQSNAGGGNPSTGDNSGFTPQIDDGPSAALWLTSSSTGGWVALAGIIAALIALVLLPAMLRFARRYRRLRALKRGTGTAASAWRELLEFAEDVGIVIGPNLTPREVVARLRRVRGMSGEGAESLERIRAAVELEGYGRPAVDSAGAAPSIKVLRNTAPTNTAPSNTAPSNTSLAGDLATVLARLSASVDRGVRMRAALAPPSLVRRARLTITRFA
jgi:transglutaminase-like putative cysteine protease